MDGTTDSRATTVEQAVSLLVQPDEPIVEEQVEEPVVEAEASAASDDYSDDEYADDTGVEEDEAEAETHAVDDANLIPVKVDGKIEMWTIDQLKQSAAGQGYIQKQMRENAETKKQVSEAYQQLLNERQALAQMYQQLSTGQAPALPPRPPADELLDSDPIGYMQDKARYDRELQAYQQTALQMQQLQAQQAELTNRARQAYMEDQKKLLVQVIPEFSDQKAGTALRDQIVRTATQDYGYDPQELSGVTDHRHVRVLHDAMRYRQMMAERKGVEESKVSKARPVVKPGSQMKQDPSRQVKKRQMATAKKTGRVEDFVDLLFN